MTWRPSGTTPGPVAASRVRSWNRPAPTRPCGPRVRAAPAAAVRTGPSGTGRRRASSRGAASPRASGRQAGVVAGPGAHRVLEGQPGRGLAAPTRLLACNYTSLAAPTTCARPSPLSFANLTAKFCSSFLEQEREKDASISSSEQHGLCSLQSPRTLRLAAGARGMYFWDQSARVLSMLPLASPAPQAGVAVPAISSRGPARLVCCATSSRMKSASRSLTPFPAGVCYGETARQRPRQTASLGRRYVVSFEALLQMITSSSFVSSAFLRTEYVDTGLQQ